MAVKIRLARHGAKKNPFYRIVVAENDFPRDGRFVEILGTYDPLKDPAEVNLKQDRVRHWLSKGAIASDTVRSLFKKQGVYAPAEASEQAPADPEPAQEQAG